MKVENRQLLVWTHLSQLLDIVTGFVNAIKVSNGEKPHYPLSIKFV